MASDCTAVSSHTTGSQINVRMVLRSRPTGSGGRSGDLGAQTADAAELVVAALEALAVGQGDQALQGGPERLVQVSGRLVVVVMGAAGGFALARLAGRFIPTVQLPGMLPLAAATAVLIGAGVIASLVPAARAARIDVLQALRAE